MNNEQDNYLPMKIFSDKTLSQKIERAEARSTAGFVESRAELFPESYAEWIEVAGVYALFDGAESPCTQTFGLGLFDETNDAELNEIEEFFQTHNAPVFHEVSPLADPSILTLLNGRGYQPIELTSIMFRPLDAENEINLPKNSNISARIIGAAEIDIFVKTAVAGWNAEKQESEDFRLELRRIGANSKGATSFLAELNGKPSATGTLYIYDDVAELAGARTIPEYRRQGAQNALLEARLKYAFERGCTMAIMGASPGSQSQRNAEKNGFRIAYTRTKWQLKS
jgi:GNAT superfamily N-acetyltransferase